MATTSTTGPNTTGKKVNVLVYSGDGTTVESVRHCLYTLRRLLASHYAVIPVTADMLIKEPWTLTCALLVIPGGADLGYCRALNGVGNRRIEQFVRRGGAYLGLCAGGYYGSKRCEFEVGNKTLEVIGDRELGFYPGICRGGAFSGFVYHSEAGARAAGLTVSKEALNSGVVPTSFRSYYNGGSVFVDAASYADKGIEVLASYAERLNVDPGTGAAAVVYCPVGEGAAVLTGPHPEFAAANLNPAAGGPEYAEVIEALTADDKSRTDFLKACLSKLGLQVAQGTTDVPSLSSIHLSSYQFLDAERILMSLEELMSKEGYLKDENDTFRVERSGEINMGELAESLPEVSKEPSSKIPSHTDGTVDYQKIVKRLIIHDDIPSSKMTPYFNHHAFYAHLKEYQAQSKEGASQFGASLLYGEVITSTNTILEKNAKLLRILPTGTTATATTQVAGRGRGSNVWVSPAGSLLFSTVVRHPMEKMQSAPVVLIQYLAALATVRGIQSYAEGYDAMPVKLKWPNDVYALDPGQPEHKKQYTKICGILVNSHFYSNEYISVVGIGINATNASPTTSLVALANRFVGRKAAPVTLEKLLARILTVFEDLYTRFLRTGFDRGFEEMYYDSWLHTNQIVTLEAEGGVRARIKGVTRDYGFLLAEELSWDDRATGRVWQLQSDSNSFDFMKGLVRRKIN